MATVLVCLIRLQHSILIGLQDDWEELLGQIEIVIHDCEISRAKAREFQAHRDSMDEYLETYARQLDVIDKTDNPVLNKSLGMQVGSLLPFRYIFR